MSLVDNDLLSFNVFVSRNIKNSTILEVDEHLTFILEDLPPVSIGAPDLHVVGLS
jgi:hypothetical protein